MNKVEKITRFQELYREHKGALMSERINDAIEVLQDGTKITKERIAKYLDVSPSTVKKYWKAHKALIEAYNESLKYGLAVAT